MKAPYVDMAINKSKHEVKHAWEAFYGYIQTLVEGPSKIEGLLGDINNLVADTPRLIAGAKDEAKKVGMNPMKIVQAVSGATKNVTLLKNQVPKIKRVKDVLLEAKDELNGLVDHIKSCIGTCD
mmetsp:Transcript_100396/g.139540  ORF Transcript_100396/g.139540 Transcript_100396/m.139540 type:complete len:124 (+) Transcript_100396:188-559(+)